MIGVWRIEFDLYSKVTIIRRICFHSRVIHGRHSTSRNNGGWPIRVTAGKDGGHPWRGTLPYNIIFYVVDGGIRVVNIFHHCKILLKVTLSHMNSDFLSILLLVRVLRFTRVNDPMVADWGWELVREVRSCDNSMLICEPKDGWSRACRPLTLLLKEGQGKDEKNYVHSTHNKSQLLVDRTQRAQSSYGRRRSW